MAEKTLNDPLSGKEIKEIILSVVKQRLDGDCTLQDDHAYGGFSAKFDINISYLRSITKPTLVWGVVDNKPKDAELEPAGSVQVAGVYTANQPDVERTAHDLPVPVIVQTPTGPQRRRVRIERPK